MDPGSEMIVIGVNQTMVVLVATQLSVLGLYLPPVFMRVVKVAPPQIIIFNCQSTLLCVPSAKSGALTLVIETPLSVFDCICHGVQNVHVLCSAPDDHFSARPDCRCVLHAHWVRWLW